jgi:hypothetical protein
VSHGPLAEYTDHAVSVFFFGPNEHAGPPDEAWLRTVEAINSKNTFMEIADQLDVPVPVTIPYDDVARHLGGGHRERALPLLPEGRGVRLRGRHLPLRGPPTNSNPPQRRVRARHARCRSSRRSSPTAS